MNRQSQIHKQAIFLFLLMFCFQNTVAQKIITKEIKKKLPDIQIQKNIFILGKWKIKKTQGEIYEKMGDSLYKVERGFNGWVGNQFIFTPEKMTVLSYNGKPLIINSYEILNNGTSLLVKKSTGEYSLQISVDQKKMTITYTPEAYFKNMAIDDVQNVEYFKNPYHVPRNPIFYLERLTN